MSAEAIEGQPRQEAEGLTFWLVGLLLLIILLLVVPLLFPEAKIIERTIGPPVSWILGHLLP